MNQEAGEEVIPPHLDIFAIRNKRYGLSEICHVSDLALIEAQHQLIQQAFDEGLLVDSIPQAIKQACDRLRKAYAGDFLADLLPLQKVSSSRSIFSNREQKRLNAR